MNSRRTIILVVAILMAALAALGLLTYVDGLEENVYAGQELVDVWQVQAESIPKGTQGDDLVERGLIVQKKIPVEFRPSATITNPGEELTGLVAVSDLAQGDILKAGNFVTPSVVATGVTDRLEEKDMVTVTFSLGQVNAAAYLIEPGDFVNMLANYAIEDIAGSGEEEATGDGTDTTDTEPQIIYRRGDQQTVELLDTDGRVFEAEVERALVLTDDSFTLYNRDVRYLYQKAEVLAIDKSLPADLGEGGEGGAEGQNAGLITLAVPPDVVQSVLGVGAENIYLSLVPRNYEPVPLPPLDITDLTLPGEDECRLTPYGPALEAYPACGLEVPEAAQP